MPVTLKDIAGEVSMSQMTVSRALRGVENIDPQTRERIRRVAKRLGYPASRGVVVGSGNCNKNHRLRLLVPSIRTRINEFGLWYLDRMIEGLSLRLHISNGQLLVAHFDSVEHLIDFYGEHNCHGFVLRQILPASWLVKLQDVGPVVYALSYDYDYGVDCVYPNEHRSAIRIYRRLVEHGHKKIAWLGILDHHQGNELADRRDDPANIENWLANIGHSTRHAAWATLTCCQLPEYRQPLLLIPRDWRCDSLEVTVKRGLDQLLAQDPMPTAVVCSSDPLAIELMRQLRDAGIAVPGRMSVVSYGGSPEVKAHRPEITSLAMPMEMVGRVIPELIERRLADPEAAPLSVQLEMGWFAGQTLGPAPAQEPSTVTPTHAESDSPDRGFRESPEQSTPAAGAGHSAQPTASSTRFT